MYEIEVINKMWIWLTLIIIIVSAVVSLLVLPRLEITSLLLVLSLAMFFVSGNFKCLFMNDYISGNLKLKNDCLMLDSKSYDFDIKDVDSVKFNCLTCKLEISRTLWDKLYGGDRVRKILNSSIHV